MAETVYFFYSFGFILARTIAVSLYAAWINDESKKPLEVLNSIPSEHYCTEVSENIIFTVLILLISVKSQFLD